MLTVLSAFSQTGLQSSQNKLSLRVIGTDTFALVPLKIITELNVFHAEFEELQRKQALCDSLFRYSVSAYEALTSEQNTKISQQASYIMLTDSINSELNTQNSAYEASNNILKKKLKNSKRTIKIVAVVGVIGGYFLKSQISK